ncbi:MAG: hypothetical protein ABIG93_03855 [archaeon]|nr:ribbon-helix-helix domain-containing protein [Nanoarchaeota archaeon]
MKRKISITVNEDVLVDVDASVLTGKFRNRSHAFEYALKRMGNKK